MVNLMRRDLPIVLGVSRQKGIVMDFQKYEEALCKALKFADENHPKAHPYRRAAFANSVAYHMTGKAGGYGGPSVREHVACRLGEGREMDFDEACSLVEESIFGPLSLCHHALWLLEYCFQDDPEDVAILSGCLPVPPKGEIGTPSITGTTAP